MQPESISETWNFVRYSLNAPYNGMVCLPDRVSCIMLMYCLHFPALLFILHHAEHHWHGA